MFTLRERELSFILGRSTATVSCASSINLSCIKSKLHSAFNMCKYRVLSLCLVLLSSVLLAARNEEFQRIYIAAVRCKVSPKFVYPNYTCFAKSYRNFSTGSGWAYFKTPLSDVIVSNLKIFRSNRKKFNKTQMQGKMLFKYGTIYRDVITTPKVEICPILHQMLSNETISNKLVSSAAKFIQDTYPGMIHECPYSVSNTNFLLLF